MQRELLPVPQRDGDRQRHQAAVAAGEPRPLPQVAPRGAGDEVLEVGGERRRAGDGAVDPRVAEHLAPGAHPGLAALVVRRRSLIGSSRCVEVAEQRAGDLERPLQVGQVGARAHGEQLGARRCPSAISLLVLRRQREVLGAGDDQRRRGDPAEVLAQVQAGDDLAAGGVALVVRSRRSSPRAGRPGPGARRRTAGSASGRRWSARAGPCHRSGRRRPGRGTACGSVFAEVHRRASRSTRSGLARGQPHRRSCRRATARRRAPARAPTSSSSATRSSTRSSSVYGPAGAGDSPCPRVS